MISGVVLLTHKKPERTAPGPGARLGLVAPNKRRGNKPSDTKALVDGQDDGEDERESLRSEGGDGDNAEELWAVGEASDDEDRPSSATRLQRTPTTTGAEEGVGLMLRDDGEQNAHELEYGRLQAGSTRSRRASDPFRDEPDDFGEFANSHSVSRGR